jgi:uncharacterized protein (TIGR03000 family)
MYRKAISFGGILLLGGAVVLATPALGRAQRYGGGGNYGGAYSGGYVGGLGNGYRYAHYGYPHDQYTHYPYGFPYPYYNTSPYSGLSSTYDSGSSGSYGGVAPSGADGVTAAALSAGSYQAFYPPATATTPANTHARVTVKAPADARVWFDGEPTTSTGPVRQFYSPPLTPGRRYSYEVRARWTENGREVTQTRQVDVTPGTSVEVNFPVASKTADRTPVTQER